MFIVALPILCAIPLALGFALGITPGVNENLHWTIWGYIPIAGLLVGALAGSIQPKVLQALGVKASVLMLVAAFASSAAGMVAIDYGIYRQAIRPHRECAAAFPTFERYLAARIDSPSELAANPRCPRSQARPLSAAASRLIYHADLAIAGLAALVAMAHFRRTRKFCPRCRRYMKSHLHLPRFLGDVPDEYQPLFNEIREATRRKDGPLLKQLFAALPIAPLECDVRLQMEEQSCERCGRTVVMGRLEKHGKRDRWATMLGTDFEGTLVESGDSGREPPAPSVARAARRPDASTPAWTQRVPAVAMRTAKPATPPAGGSKGR